jgi:hypothetical protein
VGRTLKFFAGLAFLLMATGTAGWHLTASSLEPPAAHSAALLAPAPLALEPSQTGAAERPVISFQPPAIGNQPQVLGKAETLGNGETSADLALRAVSEPAAAVEPGAQTPGIAMPSFETAAGDHALRSATGERSPPRRAAEGAGSRALRV